MKQNPQCVRTPMRPPSTLEQSHNLNIENYTFDELLDLFHLDYNSSLDDLKQAKKIALSMHPDKSRLPSEYFLFYKKAFQVVIDFFREKTKINQTVPSGNENKMVYQPIETADERTAQHLRQKINNIKSADFKDKFNELYEKNVPKKIDDSRNNWFVNNDPLFEFDAPTSTKDISHSIDKVKERTSSLVQYKGVQPLNFSSGGGRYHDELDEDPNEYVSCDPFSKLKFDDLRKVHRDQTVLSVSERDYDKVEKYNSIDQYNRARSTQDLTPVSDIEGNRILRQRETEMEKKIAQMNHAANLKRMEYEKMNGLVLSSFLMLEG